MAQGDAVYGRVNVDWPTDPRCQALPDNDARWLNQVLWLLAVKERASVLPAQYTPRYLAWISNVTEDVLQAALASMCEGGLIGFSERGALVIFGVKENHQRLGWRVDPIKTVPNPYGTATGWLWVGYGTSTVTKERDREREIESIQQGSESECEGEHKPIPNSEIIKARFEAFWLAYPKRVGKGAARKAFVKLRPSLALSCAILEAIEAAKGSTQWMKDGGQYIPLPTTWLNQERWEDDIETAGSTVKDIAIKPGDSPDDPETAWKFL